jgi:hypothetical protein
VRQRPGGLHGRGKQEQGHRQEPAEVEPEDRRAHLEAGTAGSDGSRIETFLRSRAK